MQTVFCYCDTPIQRILKSNATRLAIQTQFSFTEYVVKYADDKELFLKKGMVKWLGSDKEMGRQISHIILTKMFNVNKSYQNAFNQHASHFKNRFVVGFHFRTGYGAFLDNGYFLNISQVDDAVNIANKWSENQKDVLWFISSDNYNFINKTIKLCKYETYVINDLPIEHSGHRIHSLDGVMRAVFDEKLLGLSNRLILTTESTYSEGALYYNKISLHNNTNYYYWLPKAVK